MSVEPLTVGIDVGGTNLRVGLVSAGETLVWRTSVPTPTPPQPEDVAAALTVAVGDGLAATGASWGAVVAIGLGVPGPLHRALGVARLSPNLGWRNVPIARLVRERIPSDAPVFIEHDVRVVTVGEWRYGAGRGAADLLGVTLGTGVGGSLVLYGRPYYGADEAAGEIGHIQLDPNGPPCGCGNRGCVEQYASATAVAREAARRGIRTDRGAASARDVADLAAAGDVTAREILAAAGKALGHGVQAAVNILNVERVVVTGGLAAAGPALWDPFVASLRSAIMPPLRERLAVVRGELGDDAGIVGAAWMARAELEASADRRR